MTPVLDQLGKGAHVGILRLRSLGDCVLTTPAITLLKERRPDLRVGVVVEPAFSAVFTGNPDIDDILPPKLAALRRFAPLVCLNLHGGTRSMWMTLLSGARFRAGFAHHRYSGIYNVQIPTAQEILGVSRKVHTAEHLASAMFYLGTPRREIPRARLEARPLRAAHPYAVIHSLASSPDKTWPAERFLELASHLQEHCALEPVFIGGLGDDLSAFRPFRAHSGPLEQTKSLLRSASLFIGNDSGPAHMAAALGIPLVVLFSVSDPAVWAPWKAQAEQITAGGGIENLPVARVVEALERLRVRA
ncbi:MAG: glycosyltransferase family 9 protein [Acidobacteria bacterium]|nr:glycosyltransferase family 9 protein [Acidobacteriota bacterium]